MLRNSINTRVNVGYSKDNISKIAEQYLAQPFDY
ncbi:hypothetical protein CFU_0867 [Collimonas fungivorans Ter331]|uniref:Uncharacterized protein n=1 Tax=Collimonas fungivorans (strain Ter331) TaxID=1005048 RepID=G0AIB7_COLFT|nr:hypothetical protein CFU_0867 [Collimonas fungivorans Ter331]